MEITWLQIFFANWIFNIILMEFCAIRKIQPLLKADEALNEKYKAFRRHDLKWFNRPWLYLTCHGGALRVILAFSDLLRSAFLCQLVVIGLGPDDNIKGWRYFVMRCTQWQTSWWVQTMASSCVWVFSSKSDICYKKYLGPDWKPDFDKAHTASVICNHSAFLDANMNCRYQLAHYIAKEEIKRVPFIGAITVASQCYFIQRSDKQGKYDALLAIQDRLRECEETGRYDPMLIHPEGGTTNGKYLINFKKGAFLGLRSTMPKIHKFHSWFQQPSSGVLDGIAHYIIGAATPFSWAERIEMPIFNPNEYFFKHHQKEGEEKWQTYMRVVRQLMGEVGNYELLDVNIEDKFEYKKLLFPNKNKSE